MKDVGHDYGIVLMVFSNFDAECVEDCRGKSYEKYPHVMLGPKRIQAVLVHINRSLKQS